MKRLLDLLRNTDWLRLKYSVLAALDPRCHPAVPIDAAWDKELWGLLIAGDIRWVGDYTAAVGDYLVWISNYPYASGALYNRGYRIGDCMQCSRATALFLNNQLPAARLLDGLRFSKQEYRRYRWDREFKIDMAGTTSKLVL